MGTCVMTFDVAGNFITRRARELFWLEGENIDVVLKLLHESLICDQLTYAEIDELCYQVLLGKADIVGSTRTNDYGVKVYKEGEYNPNTVMTMKDLFDRISKLTTEKKALLVERAELIAAFADMVEDDFDADEADEDISDIDLFDDVNPEEYCKIKGESYADLGWLDKEGNFYKVPWGEHALWAYEKLMSMYGGIERLLELDEYKGESEFYLKVKSVTTNENAPEEVKEIARRSDLSKAADCLCKLGWLLLHCPENMRGLAHVTMLVAAPTKKQAEFLYGFYMARGNRSLAEQYMQYL